MLGDVNTMSIKTRISPSKGVQEIKGSTGLEIQTHIDVVADVSNVGISPFALKTTTVGTAFTVTVPGFYYVSGSTQCTGTLPRAHTVPGAEIVLMLLNGEPMMLTGTVSANNAPYVFSTTGMISASIVGVECGNKLVVASSGSVGVRSDGRHWIPTMSSGTLTIAA